MDSQPVWPFLFYLLSVFALVLTMLGVAWLMGQRREDPSTLEPYESGIVPAGGSQMPVSVEFYLVAIFFVLFDLETVFIFAWAVAFYELGWAGYLAIMVFIVVLFIALIYALRVGALDWGLKTRVGLEQEKKP